MLPENLNPIIFKDVVLTQLADYKIRARVLSTHKYWLGQSANLMPIDLAVGWNEMSDSAVIEKLKKSAKAIL